MVSRTTARFWRAYAALPAEAQRQARAAYRLFCDDPRHPGLRFEQVPPPNAASRVRGPRGGGGAATWSIVGGPRRDRGAG